ncbi:amylo-alpha-1,6-glucosidase [Rhodothermus marinus]|uniref:amylo-alpha-1,6-glucosidase n=1 Tax=Rhodothermus marinus TaxID=29549 RepID=UPI0037CBAC78
MDETLIKAALAVLDENWTGRFTRPSARLYPHQWSWDSAFIAIGYAHVLPRRAEQELRSLFTGQWRNGLLPHIVFHGPSGNYFPGPEVWAVTCNPNASSHPPTSGIVQPPNHAIAAWHLYQYARDRTQALVFLNELYPRLKAWHDYLYRERDPFHEGLVYIRHPWESGMDNAPLWDQPLSRIAIDGPLPFQRVDKQVVNPADRPTDTDYARYLQLVSLFRTCRYEESRIQERCPFLIQDVLFNTLLCQAERDLAKIARVLGRDPEPHEARAAQTARAINQKLWDEAHGIYVDYDLVAESPIDVHVVAGFVPLFAGIPSSEQARRMCANLNSRSFCRLGDRCYAVPSYDKQAPGFSRRRYWRGPVWINMNWLLYRGLQRYGEQKYAMWVRNAIIDLPRRYGFYEYYDPEAGCGHGADRFSWTAALVLDVLYTCRSETVPPS